MLDRRECLRLLSGQSIGRVVLVLDGLPAAFPVNISVRDGDVYFVSSPGEKLERAVARSVMSVEVDCSDALSHEGWSVLVTGRAEVVTDAATAAGVKAGLEAWAPGPHDHVVRVRSTFVSGRRITRAGKP